MSYDFSTSVRWALPCHRQRRVHCPRIRDASHHESRYVPWFRAAWFSYDWVASGQKWAV